MKRPGKIQNRIGKREYIFSVILLALLFSCRTVQPLQEWKGEIGSRQWSLSLLEGNKAVLTLPFKGTVEIRGEAFQEDEKNWVFYADSLHLFYNWHDGWTDSDIDLKGILRLHPESDETWTVTVIETPVIESATRAEIRYRRTKMTGDRAVDFMNRRLARTRSAADFISSELKISDYDFDHRKKGLYSEKFLRDLRSLLFPEVYGYSQTFPRPRVSGDQTDRFVREEGILWDTFYSAEYFPDELRNVRNSGTLFRDFEEASDLLNILYLWQELWTHMLPRSAVQEF